MITCRDSKTGTIVLSDGQYDRVYLFEKTNRLILSLEIKQLTVTTKSLTICDGQIMNIKFGNLVKK